MNHSASAKEKLRNALAAEKVDTSERLLRYKSLTAKLADYQVGIGPAPTEDEFNQWLADVKHAVNLQKLIVGG